MADVERSTGPHDPPDAPRPADEVIAELAGGQYGAVARGQLAARGVSSTEVRRRIERGILHRVHRGVYAVGHTALVREARWLAATLAASGAVLSHRSAAALWELLENHSVRVDVTAAAASRRTIVGVRFHRARSLDAHDITAHRAIPTTTVARTLLDLAETATKRQLERAFEQALTIDLLDVAELRGTMERNPGRHGLNPLGALLNHHHAASTATRSELEERFLAFVRDHLLPAPVCNARVGNHIVDFLWPHAKLIVELDGYAFHTTRQAFERDRRRDEDLTLLGYRVIRVTWARLAEPRTLAASLRALLK